MQTEGTRQTSISSSKTEGKDRGWSKITHFTLESKEFEALVSQTSFQLVDIVVTNECEQNRVS